MPRGPPDKHAHFKPQSQPTSYQQTPSSNHMKTQATDLPWPHGGLTARVATRCPDEQPNPNPPCKLARVVLVPKFTDLSKPSNYRLNSILSIINQEGLGTYHLLNNFLASTPSLAYFLQAMGLPPWQVNHFCSPINHPSLVTAT